MVLRTTLVLILAATLAGCSGADGSDPQPAPVPAADPAIAALVPRGIAEDGRLSVATDPDYPPMEFLGTDGQVQGADIDLVTALAAVLDLTPQFEQQAYTDIPIAVRTGRFELGVSALTVRSGEQLLNNALLYLHTGSQLVRGAAQPDLTRDTLCGARVAALSGSVQLEELADVSSRCRKQGQPAVDAADFPDPDAMVAAVRAGQAAGMLADSAVTQDAVARFPDDLAAASGIYGRRPLGMLTAAEYTRFTRALQRALQQLIDTGYYREVLQRWNLAEGGVQRAKVKWAEYARPKGSGR